MSFFRSKQASATHPAETGAPTPANEVRRLSALYQLRLLDTAPEERFNRLTRIAASALQAPIGLLSLVDEVREWWKSSSGWNGVREVPRRHSFGGYAIAGEGRLLVVPDATKDPRFTNHPLVAGREGIRFFAGYVLTNSEGFKVGVLGVLDRQPRELSPAREQALADLALLAEQELRGIPLRDTLERLAQAERRAEEQHARFAAFMENLPNVAFLKDKEGRTLFGNRYYEELFGVHLQDVLGKRDDQWLPPDVAQETMAADFEVIESGRSLRIEEEIPTVLGVRHWLTFKFPVPTPSGERLLGGIAVDITTQKETERQLQELVSLQHALVNSANVAIISTGPNGLVRTFNTAAERLLGYAAEEVIDHARPDTWHLSSELERIAEEIQRQSGEVIAPTTEVLRWGLRHGAVAEHELNLLRKDGSTFRASLAITALWSGTEITGYMAIIQDVTARREFEEVQRRAKEEAEEANRAKSQFVANMSHEVRTPLNGILGVTAMLLETDLEPRQRELAEFVLSSGHGLLNIVNDVLDFSKVEAGRMELEAIDFDLVALLQSVCDLYRARADEKGLSLVTEIEVDVPTNLHGDPTRLRQVLNNLASNAIKFSENGTIRFAVTLDGSDGSLVCLRFDVMDRGIGIAEEKQARIFDPFTQADISTTRLYGGTGLGLSICRQFVELMGGSIGVNSAPGEGSDFWFTANLRIAGGEADEQPPTVAPEVEAMPRLRVLLAEDSAINRLVTTHQLQKLGCEVETVENGQQAIDVTAAIRFDLILMDCQMPVLDGYAATTAIRARERSEGRHTRIIAVTANALPGERERCLAAGMDGYLPKPFKAEELYSQIRSVLRSAPKVSAEPLDPRVVAELREECGPEGEALFQRYVNYLREDLTQAENELAAAEQQESAEMMRQTAHHLRGAALHFGAHDLMAACIRLEKVTAKEGPFSHALSLVPALRAEIARVRDTVARQFGGAAPSEPSQDQHLDH